MKPEYKYVIISGDSYAADANATKFTTNRHNAFTWTNMIAAENVMANRADLELSVSMITHYSVEVDPDISMDVSIIQQFIDIVEDSNERYESLLKLEEQLNDQLLDLEHYIEDTNLNARDGYRAYKKLQEIRRRRRLVKERLHIMQCIQTSGIKLESLKAIVKPLTNVKYKPRFYEDFENILD